MNNNEIVSIINEQVNSKVTELSELKQVRWEGGRLYFETSKISIEIKTYSVENQIIYLEKLFKKEFVIRDNWPTDTPDITLEFKNWLIKSISKLKIKIIQDKNKLLHQDYDEVSLEGLDLEKIILKTLNSRLDEIKKCLKANAPLSVIFLSGSTLEGILMSKVKQFPKIFNQLKATPKDSKTRKPKSLNKWTLNDFINTAFEIRLIDLDLKKLNQFLRDFRNYIHPFEQINSGFDPDMPTANVCWQILKTAIYQVNKNKYVLTKEANA